MKNIFNEFIKNKKNSKEIITIKDDNFICCIDGGKQSISDVYKYILNILFLDYDSLKYIQELNVNDREDLQTIIEMKKLERKLEKLKLKLGTN